MSAVFLKLLNMSITASWLILAVLAARLLLKKAPKWIVCLLWGLAALRLLIPFSLQSVFSVVPSVETVPMDIAVSPQPAIHTGFTIVNHTVNPILTETFAPDPTASVNPLQTVVFVASVVWAVGASIMLLYALISFLRLRKTVAARVPIAERVFACDEVKTPFILGVIRPKIYVPSAMGGETLDCVLRHEEAHLKRRDHWWKPLGFLLLSLYWFNPLCWVAYILLCRDIETACDEKVIRDMDRESVAAYSQALLDCGFQRKSIAACPLAFGEVGVKQRVKGILNYKKPAFWIILIALVVCVVLAVCLLTDPRSDEPPTESTNESPAEGTAVDQLTEPLPTEVQPVLSPAEKWFDFLHGDDQWSGTKQITLDAFPDTVFVCDQATVKAVTDQATVVLIRAMPIHSVYSSDLNGDGAPEICATVNFGPGRDNQCIRVVDYRSGIDYSLSSPDEYDYCLNLLNGELVAEICKQKEDNLLRTVGITLEGKTLKLVFELPNQDMNIMEAITHIYTNEELTEIQHFEGALSELGQKYPIEFLRESNLGQYVVYRSESDLVIVGFELDGSQQALPFRGHMAHSSEEFRTIQVGDTLDEVRAFDPDGSYLWLYTGVQLPPVSTHCTTDGYFVSIEYSDENIVTKIEIHMI